MRFGAMYDLADEAWHDFKLSREQYERSVADLRVALDSKVDDACLSRVVNARDEHRLRCLNSFMQWSLCAEKFAMNLEDRSNVDALHACTGVFSTRRVDSTAFDAHLRLVEVSRTARYRLVTGFDNTCSSLSLARKRLRLAEAHLDICDEGCIEQESDARFKVIEAQQEVQLLDLDMINLVSEASALQVYFPEVSRIIERHLSSARGAARMASDDLLACVMVPGRRRADYSDDDSRVLYKGRHLIEKVKFSGQPCVLKRFDVCNPSELKRFLREARALRRLRHPNIVELQCVFFENDRLSGERRGRA